MRNTIHARTKRPRTSHLVQSVDRALTLLDLFANDTTSWGISELSTATGLSKTAVFRLVRTLGRHDYTTQDEAHRYRLGMKPLVLASVVLRRFEVHQVARPTMLELAERTGESVVLTAPSQNGVICLDTVDGPQRIRASFQVGRITPWHAGAAGKLHLAFLPKDQMKRMVARSLPRYTERTITDHAALLRNLARIRLQGYASTVGEFDPGVAAVTAPIVDSRKEVIAGISIGGPASRFTDNRLPQLIREVQWAASEISLRLLGSPAAAGLPDSRPSGRPSVTEHGPRKEKRG